MSRAHPLSAARRLHSRVSPLIRRGIRRCGPTLGHRDELIAVLGPVVKRLGVEVCAIRPLNRSKRRVQFDRVEHLQILQGSEYLALENRPEVYLLLSAIIELQRQRVGRHDFETPDSVNRMIHVLGLHLPQWLNLERRTAGMQESPVVQEFVMMDLCPCFDEALLRARKIAADTLNRIEGEHGLEFLVRCVEVRPVMGAPISGNMRMMMPKNREISGTDVLYIVVVDRVGLDIMAARASA